MKKFTELGIKLKPYRSVYTDNYQDDKKFGQDTRSLHKKNSFFSTPNFINDLTHISVKLVKSPSKMNFLKSKLQFMNENLPAACYLPVLSGDQRNYMVLNIVYEEIRLFITATKAPFLILIEVFQPQELELHIQDEINQHKPRAFEILEQFNIFNKDQKELLKKINIQLSRPVYINNSHIVVGDEKTSDGDSSSMMSIRDIRQRSKQIYKQYIHQFIEEQEKSSEESKVPDYNNYE